MGNALSEEEQEQILEEAYNMEDPDMNAAKQRREGSVRQSSQRGDSNSSIDANGKDEGKLPNNTHKHRRGSSTLSERQDQEERRKRQHKEQQEMSAAEQQKKLSYFQMARLGYQELVNAIIRPPRADYKVRLSSGFAVSNCNEKHIDEPVSNVVFFSLVDGSAGTSRLYLLWQAIHSHRLYPSNKAWI